MSRPALEVADIFREHGAAWRRANAGHVSLNQMKVMSAIERCRTVALGGHVARCEGCAHTVIAYNSCLMGKFRNGELTACAASSPEQFEATAYPVCCQYDELVIICRSGLPRLSNNASRFSAGFSR